MNEIRHARIDDAGALAELTTALGYPAAAGDLAPRLARVLADDTQCVLVSCGAGDAPVGWVHVGERALLEADRYFEILGLVVAATFRRQGRAQRLVTAAEDWARARGASLINVRSNVIRPESHPFYLQNGYERVKTQHVYRKPLV